MFKVRTISSLPLPSGHSFGMAMLFAVLLTPLLLILQLFHLGQAFWNDQALVSLSTLWISGTISFS
ncbi:MAG: hypothetical protein DWQ01_10850 [Planctomycetota bacterium]|nr:MAG: hypothetical protein DWQ01_10850 [Planctomycetota bacterium]